MMPEWYIGTMGFGYKDWEGSFYPLEILSKDYLSYYSRIFNAVEIDSTFYGTPRESSVMRWISLTPHGFKFCVKVPKAITHDLGLSGDWGLMEGFIERMRLLDEKLGAILLQFPPSFTADQQEVLDRFLEHLPLDLKFAVEVRDASWYTAGVQTEQILSRYGVAWAATEYPGLPRELKRTAGFAYIRWIGRHGSFHRHDHERIDRAQELKAWWEILKSKAGEFSDIFGFMNNDFAGFAPATANRFKGIAGLPVQTLHRPQQPRLF